jgi:Uma2 family endonuclease
MTTTRLLTAEDLWNMPDNGKGYELIRGELHPMAPAGQEHSNLGIVLGSLLHAFVRKNQLGAVTGSDGGYILAKSPETVRAPDLGFVRQERLAGGRTTAKYFEGAPDLAVEIISPTDSYQDIDEKVQEFLDAGTKLVWVVSPKKKTITIYRSNQKMALITKPGDVLEGEDVLPGFSVRLDEIFE